MILSDFEVPITNIEKYEDIGWIYYFDNPGSVNIYDANFELIISDVTLGSYTYNQTSGYEGIKVVRSILDFPPTLHIFDSSISNDVLANYYFQSKSYITFLNVLDAGDDEVIYHTIYNNNDKKLEIFENNINEVISIKRIDNKIYEPLTELYYNNEFDGIENDKTSIGYILKHKDNNYDYFEVIGNENGELTIGV